MPFRVAIFDGDFSKHRLNWLRMVQGASRDITRHDAKAERLLGVAFEDGGVVGMLAVHRLRLHADLINSGMRHAFSEAID